MKFVGTPGRTLEGRPINGDRIRRWVAAMQNWFYRTLGHEFGPLPANEIADLLQSGAITEADDVRKEGTDNWLPLKQVRGEFSSGPTEISDLSELSFTFENNNDAPRKKPSPAESSAPKAVEEMYMVESLGQILGPMPISEVQGLIDAGSLSGGDKIKPEAAADWKKIVGFGNLKVSAPPPAKKKIRKKAKGKKRGPSKGGKSKVAEEKIVEDILSEVFSEPEKPKSSYTPTSQPVTEAPSSPSPSSAATASTPQPAANVTPEPTTPTPGPPTPSPYSSGSAPYRSPQPAFVPSKKKKSSGSFEMPSPQTMGIIGGVAVVALLLLGFMTGMFSGISFSNTGPQREFLIEYSVLIAKEPTPEKWKEMGQKYRSRLQGIADSIDASDASEELKNSKKSAEIILEMLKTPADDVEARQPMFREVMDVMKKT